MFRRTFCWVSVAGGALLFTVAGAARADEPVSTPRRTAAGPVIVVKTKIEERNPRAFARKLSDLLGTEVQLPSKGFPRLTVPAGEWTATQILNGVAKQIEGSAWQLVYRYTKRASSPTGTVAANSKLPPTSRITVQAESVSFSRTVQLIQDAGACVLEFPEPLPQGRFRLAWQDVPLEAVLKEVGERAGLVVSPVIRFEREDSESQSKRTEESLARVNERTLQQAQVANRLQEAYGQDPYSEGFPWENIDRTGLGMKLARELGIPFVEVVALIDLVRLEAQAQAELRRSG